MDRVSEVSNVPAESRSPETVTTVPEGQLRVSDRERDDTIDVLSEAATDGRLTLDEYSERAGKALEARTRDDLRVLVRDLGTGMAVREPRPVALPPDSDTTDRVLAIFGSESRRGRWPVPARLESKAIFGEIKIELQDATLHSRVTVIDARAVFGSVVILVPEGVEVQMTGSAIFGNRDCQITQAAPPGAPVVQVRSRAIFGEVLVRHPGWKEGVRNVVEAHLDRHHS